MKTLVGRHFALFVCIGLGATAIHVLIAAHLIATHLMPPGLEVLRVHYLAGIAAVVLVLRIVSFGLHSLWTFRNRGAGEPCHCESIS